MKLYDYPASANCYKVRLALAELGIAHERVEVDIFAGDTLTDAYALLNPARSTPVLVLDDGHPLVESAAILCYLADDTPLMPAGRLARAELVRWLVFEQTDVVPGIGGLRFRLQTGRLSASDPEADRRRRIGDDALGLLDRHLADHEFLVADRHSVADIAVYGYVHVAGEAGFDLAAYPAVRRWLDAVRSRPGHVDDLAPYPANAAPGAGRSIYD